jgi:hypothetical protein
VTSSPATETLAIVSISSPFFASRRIWNRRIRLGHLKTFGHQIWAAQILLNLTANIADPTEEVPSNQEQPHGPVWIKTNSN